ncbi:unnamed protein product [Clonostachys rhizophaga]|uniref:Rhodopsin domain-containing protein n=1 Tax=Clonostachys rhizophaga TaxID=160324 RepID=A0A9N9W439_9HYPO|nr:unnamed protein product [Clonostachys rhizophaga]
MEIDNRGPPLQVVCYVFGVLALVATLLRCYVRVFLVKSFGVDDYFMVLALVLFIAFVASALVGVHFGAGRHLTDILPQVNTKHAIQCWWFCYLWYCLSITAVKISICWFLLRVIVKRIHLWIIYFVLGLNIVSGVAFFFITLLQCKPVYAFWDREVPGDCLGMDAVIAVTYVYGACGIICDFTCTILPMVIIWGLNMNKRSKWVLMPIMTLACVASAATVVRFVYCKDAKDPDFLYATINIVIWSTIEQGVAIMAGSLATLRPLLRQVAQNLGFSSTGPSELKDTRENNSRFKDGTGSRNKLASRNNDQFALGVMEGQGNGRLPNGHPHGERREPWDNESEEELTQDLGKGQDHKVLSTAHV